MNKLNNLHSRNFVDYSKEEILFLIENYTKFGSKYCAEQLCRSRRAIISKASELRIRFLIKLEPVIDSINNKRCRKCEKEKSKSEFNKRSDSKDGYEGKCRICEREDYNPIKIREGNVIRRTRMMDSPEKRKQSCIKSIIRGAKRRAKERGLKFDIDFNWSKTQNTEVCPVLGVKFEFISNHSAYNISIDRIDNNLGYTKENSIFICYRVNSIKSDSSVEELVRIANFYKNLENQRNKT